MAVVCLSLICRVFDVDCMGLRHSRRVRRGLARLAGLLAGLLVVGHAFGVTDEIQVYLDDINAPGTRGLQLHINTTPNGRDKPEYKGEIPPNHGLRLTPEFSWGLTDTLESGLYIPTQRDAAGGYYLGGAKVRLKWIPVHAPDEGGWYFGANGELSHLTKKFSVSPTDFELRLIGGYRNRDWIFGFNPIIEWDFADGHLAPPPEATYAFKVARTVAEGMALGLEYYVDTGKLGSPRPTDDQNRTLYLAMDLDRKPWVINFGIGRGLTGATDRWTVKAIIDIPF